jgi:hypothetical protein
MKEMGFNGAHKHQKIEDPRFHYWADKLGFLVSGEIANDYRFDETCAQRFQKECAEAVECQLTDVEQEINGLYTYDRKPKFPARIRQLNALLQ